MISAIGTESRYESLETSASASVWATGITDPGMSRQAELGCKLGSVVPLFLVGQARCGLCGSIEMVIIDATSEPEGRNDCLCECGRDGGVKRVASYVDAVLWPEAMVAVLVDIERKRLGLPEGTLVCHGVN